MEQVPDWADQPGNDYYVRRKARLMRRYDLGMWMARGRLNSLFDEFGVDDWGERGREKVEALIPQLPYIGGADNRFTAYLIQPSMLIPLVRMLRDAGAPTRRVGQMIYQAAATGYHAIPAPIRWLMGRRYFHPETIARWREDAKKTQMRRYRGDWVCQFVEGDGETFQYGLDMIECGLLKFWRSEGLDEYVPYLCLADWALWKSVGVEATRTQTLANGAPRCDYRYVRLGKNGPSGWPPESNMEWTGRYET
jgi:hypothetical protein